MDDQFGYFNLGPRTLTVPMALHAETRQKLIDAFKAVQLDSEGEVVFLYDPISLESGPLGALRVPTIIV